MMIQHSLPPARVREAHVWRGRARTPSCRRRPGAPSRPCRAAPHAPADAKHRARDPALPLHANQPAAARRHTTAILFGRQVTEYQDKVITQDEIVNTPVTTYENVVVQVRRD